MSEGIRAVALLWNEESDKFVFFLEEFCLEMKESGLASPVVVNCRDAAKPTHFLLSDCKELGIKGLKGIARGKIPYINPSEFAVLKKGETPAGQHLYLLLCDEDSLPKVSKGVDDFLFIALPGSDSSSAVFRYLQRYTYQSGRYPRIHILIAGEGRLEDAAAAFISIRDDVQKFSKNQVDLIFTGSYSIDFEKIAIMRSSKLPYRDLFKGDSFYGQLLYNGKKLASTVETIELDGGIDAFFGSIAP